MALRGNHSALSMPASVCVCVWTAFTSACACLGSHCAHSSSHMQTTNLCHLHQNNYSKINTPFDHFHSDLIWSRAVKAHRGRWSNPCLMELISTVCSTFSRQPCYKGISSSFSAFSLPAWSLQPCLFRTEIRVKLASRINLDFDCVTHFFWAVYHVDYVWDKKSRPFVLSAGWRCTGSVLVTALLPHVFPSPFSLKANSIRNLISLHYKEWYFHPADSRHCVRAFGRFNAGKSLLFWQIVDILNITCLDISVFCDME